MVNSPGWKVPVEPGQELERLLKACLELARSEQDDENEACQKFYQDTLSNSFLKVLTDSAVNSWTPEIQVSLLSAAARRGGGGGGAGGV